MGSKSPGTNPTGPLYSKNTRCEDLPSNLRAGFFRVFEEEVRSSGMSESRLHNYTRILGYAPRESSGYTIGANDEIAHSAAELDQGATGQEVSMDRAALDNPHWQRGDAMRASLESYRVVYGRESTTYRLQAGGFTSRGRQWVAGQTVRKFTLSASTSVGLLAVSADQINRGNSHAELNRLIQLAKTNPSSVVETCQTRLFFKDSASNLAEELRRLSNACTPGAGSAEASLCFDRWAAICPAYTIRLALQLPDSYFARMTKENSAPQCEAEFRRIAGHR